MTETQADSLLHRAFDDGAFSSARLCRLHPSECPHDVVAGRLHRDGVAGRIDSEICFRKEVISHSLSRIFFPRWVRSRWT
jgi:hypothetical protein